MHSILTVMIVKYRYLLYSLACWVGILLVKQYVVSRSPISQSTASIQLDLDKTNLHAMEALNQFGDPATLGEWYSRQSILYYVVDHDSMIYWNDITPPGEITGASLSSSFLPHKDSWYFFQSTVRNDLKHIIGIPIMRTIVNENNPGQKYQIFSPDRSQSHLVDINQDLPEWLQWIVVLLYVLGLVFAVTGIKNISLDILSRQGMISSLLILAGAIFSVRLGSLYLLRSVTLNKVILFDDRVNPSLLSPTLGDLMINIGMLCTLVWFIRSFVKPNYFHKVGKSNLGIALLNYGMVYLSAVVMLHAFRQLVMGSGLSFDFEYIFYLDVRSILALMGILLLAIALFVLDLHLLRIIRHLGLSAKERWLINSTALSLVFGLLWVLPVKLPMGLLIGLAAYLTLLDLFIDYFKPHAAWYLIWTMTGSILISSLLYQFHMEKEWDQRIHLANALKTKLYQANNIPPSYQESFLRKQLNQQESSSAYLALYELQYVDAEANQNITQANRHIPDPSRHAVYTSLDDHTGFYLYKKSNQLFKALSFFSYIFILFNILLVGIALLNKKLKWFSFSVFKFFPSHKTLRYRIQISMLVMSICSFLLIAVVIIFYIKKNATVWQPDLNQLVEGDEYVVRDILTSGNSYNNQIQVYDAQGLMQPDQSERMPYNQLANVRQAQARDLEGYKTILVDHKTYYLKNNTPYIGTQFKRRLNDFLGALLNVYVFLLVLIVLISMIVANSIAKPLTILSSKLTQIQIGGTNQRLEWNHQDELGALIRNYNEMIQELDRSTRMLALTERETAWREMAKQVAHEIKNPLTPMKLITQHLQNSIQRTEQDEIPALVKRVTQTLIEQIENLSKIASEFSNFAKLPAPENEKLALNEVVTSTHDLFRKREDMDIHLRVPIDEIYVFADKNHIIRVLTNLIKNAIQAIPLGRRGRIEIMLYKQDERAIVKVSDNGCGIPDSMKDKVFYPNFTTKNSGTGLGLAIVRDIIDSCNGHIFFNTYENVGTEFFIELPLMHMAANFHEEQRVVL
ncbi:MAG: HAMP domain-containing histidine kinase [Saprospiraceae bacterium]|nr:HAMP domain-containing histidine kinase [Saprospiraceae bacterium]